MNPQKRYAIIFAEWSKTIASKSTTWYDTEEEMAADIDLIKELNSNCARPVRNSTKTPVRTWDSYANKVCYWKLDDARRFYDFNDDAKFWGYVILDFEKETFKFAYDGIYGHNNKADKNSLALKDAFFRREGEVPKGYVWDEGEYEGWLQFRFGDGKNAVGYVEPTPQKEKPIEKNEEPIYPKEEISEAEELQAEYDNLNVAERKKLLMDRW